MLKTKMWEHQANNIMARFCNDIGMGTLKCIASALLSKPSFAEILKVFLLKETVSSGTHYPCGNPVMPTKMQGRLNFLKIFFFQQKHKNYCLYSFSCNFQIPSLETLWSCRIYRNSTYILYASSTFSYFSYPSLSLSFFVPFHLSFTKTPFLHHFVV